MGHAATTTHRLYRRWVRATSLGWLLGLALTVALALAADLVGGGAQFMVGVGIGAGVGYMQGRGLVPWLTHPAQWFTASTVGMGALFVLHDVLRAGGADVPFSLPLYVLAGSVVTGLWQRALLRPVTTRADWWVPASLVGWGLPAAGIAMNDARALGPASQLASLAAIFLGGLMLGATSGWALVRIVPGRTLAKT